MEQLNILWTNADVLTSEKMVMMYATNSMLYKWWAAVTVIIWGATAKLVAENENIQTRIKLAQQAGVQFSACKALHGSTRRITIRSAALGIEVKYWGEGLTDILKSEGKLLTI